MNDSTTGGQPPAPKMRSFAAMRNSGFRAQFTTYVLAMMADNIEHVISYWVVFQKFHSPALGGFAVVSHWLPFLLFSVVSGALAERFDPRRVIQCGMALFIVASLSWGYFFFTDTLQMWQAMAILVVHGCAGVLWQTPNQMLLYDIVGPTELESAVRLNAMARYLAVLAGPAVGAAILLAFGPAGGIVAQYGVLSAAGVMADRRALWSALSQGGCRRAAPRRARVQRHHHHHPRHQGASDHRVDGAACRAPRRSLSAMPIVRRCRTSRADLQHGDPGIAYSMLLAADAAGGLLAGLILEGGGWLVPKPRTAMILALLWGGALTVFSLANIYWLALGFLLAAGFLELSFNAMAQSLVQLDAPPDKRGRVIGLFNMASLGLRTFSGISVGFSEA